MADPRQLSSADIATILRRAIKDDDFRKRLLSDPDKTLSESGLKDVDPAVLDFFRNLNSSNFDEAVDKLKGAGWHDPMEAGDL